ncbi:MAG: GspE/PulE family protein [Thermodesulfobacteriota bacterium]|nr:GspE/PulE family protein [Thermodesulfobacteriota bacterium]
MTDNFEKLFVPKTVCQLLVKKGILAKNDAEGVFKKYSSVKTRLEKANQARMASAPPGIRINNPVTVVDVIASMGLPRADKDAGELDEEAVFQVIADSWGVPYKKIDPLKLDLELVTNTIPRSFAMNYLVLPIAVENNTLIVATPNPFNTEVLDDIARVAQMRVVPVVSSKTDLIRTINEFFGFKKSIAAAETQFQTPTVDLGNLERYVRLAGDDEMPANDSHIVNAVNHLLSYAFDQRASDIHIEPKRDVTLVRMRIDGVLHTVYTIPKQVHYALLSRLKNMARMDMAEKRRPQDGRIKTDKGGTEAEIRVSTVPVAFGEKMVMRIMDPEILFQDLAGLGFSADDLDVFQTIINRPNGIVLVCGPTGSGKSTTLYSTLRYLSTPDVNITTVEEPIEMVHPDFNQIAVQSSVGVTFGSILRNILRQDPDIIMIGEMRDLETAQNAVQAALTGHLVLSTLHTNDAPSSLVRLLNIGIPYYLVQATLVGIVSQRLVRKICTHCRESFEMDADELRAMGIDTGKQGKFKLYQGKGCAKCRGTGYRGRVGIFEILPYTEGIRRLTTQDTDLDKLRAKAREEGMISLREDAVRKLVRGETTYQEVLRVTWA